jgi:secondary thiamine-phosphate synthase enzyme
MVKIQTLSRLTRSEVELVNITKDVHDFVAHSGIKDGLVAVITTHTTTGILVNENLECVGIDIEEALDRLIPKDAPYAHAHFLPSYGATGNNSAGHLKSMLVGNHCAFPVMDGKIICGSAQDIFLAEFDGPQRRNIYIEVIGE